MKAYSPKSFEEVLKKGCCKFIDGDVKKSTATFCGNPRDGKSPYCKEHSEICYTKTKVLREDQIEFLSKL